ncbi:major facilitator superfamily domain-containing protein [Ditylenchus destructor]|nr:major facilitator superfamily domain-containing protein [Ditylenchus destructor]
MRFSVWENKHVIRAFAGEVRIWVLAVTTLLLICVYANFITFNFTIICMIPPQSAESGDNFLTTQSNESEASSIFYEKTVVYEGRVYYDYSPIERNALFSAGALGLLVGTVPLSFFVSKFKTRHVFSIYAVISAISTLFLPIATQMGYPFLFATRIFQGLAGAPELMMVNAVTDQWSPIASAGTFLVLLSTHYQFGPIFSMPTAAGLCESRWGWPMVYYLQGSLTLILLVIFFLFFRDSPREHPLVNEKELAKIEKGKDAIFKGITKEKENVPYRSIFTDPVVWIVWLAFFSDELGYQIFQQYGPIFLNKALGMNVRETGYAAALPFVVAIVTKLICGPINDRMTFISDRTRINIFTTISQAGMITCYGFLALIPMIMNDPPIWLMQIFYTSINMFSGLAYLGLIKAAIVISRQHSHVLMSGEIIISAAIMLCMPLIVSLIAPDNTVEQWSRLFISMPLIQFTTTVIFLLFCDSKPRPWTQRIEKPDDSESDKCVKHIVNTLTTP